MSRSSTILKRFQLQRSITDKSWGFVLAKTQHDSMAWIKGIEPHTPASFSDLRKGDSIDSINCISMRGKSLKEVESFVASSIYMDIQISRPVGSISQDVSDEPDDLWSGSAVADFIIDILLKFLFYLLFSR